MKVLYPVLIMQTVIFAMYRFAQVFDIYDKIDQKHKDNCNAKKGTQLRRMNSCKNREPNPVRNLIFCFINGI